jgi:hypothetical protein
MNNVGTLGGRSNRRWRRRLAQLLLVMLVGLSMLPARSRTTAAADPGNAEPGGGVAVEVNGPQSTVQNMQILFVKENNKTTIGLRICADSPNFQLRSESVGQWMSELYNRPGSSGGCSPNPTGWWKIVINADPDPNHVFRIYATANDAMLSEGAFMQRSARTDCRVTAYGAGYCSPASPAPVSVPMADINEPTEGQTVSGDVGVRGWTADAGVLDGSTGIDAVELRVNGTVIGLQTANEARPDVGSSLGDARFVNTGFRATFNSRLFPLGAATLQLSYRSKISGNWSTVQRHIFIDQTINLPPNKPQLISPANGASFNTANVTLQVADAGDPDNRPRNYRDFLFSIERTDAPWGLSSTWRGNTWGVTLPASGSYRWRAQAGDGAAGSGWTDWRTFTATVPGPGIWNVPYYWQGDPQWGGNRIGACNNTIRNVGCALTSVAMIFKYYGVDKNPGTLNSCLGGAACPLSWGTSRIASCSGGKVRFTEWIRSFNYGQLEQKLKTGPVILELRNGGSMHFIVVLGGSGSNPANYIVNDPGIKNGSRTRLSNTMAWFRGGPAGMRIYRGTGALDSAVQSEAASVDLPVALQSPRLAPNEVITGSVELYRSTDTEMTLELAATSSAGQVTDMQVWTGQQPGDVWQPFASYVSVPLAGTYYVRFRDDQGNTSSILSVSTPEAPGTIESTPVYLPLIKK